LLPIQETARYRITSTIGAENRREQLAQTLLAMGYPSNIVQNMSQSALQDLIKSARGDVKQNVYGDIVQRGILSNEQNVIATAPTPVREYNLAQSQLLSPRRANPLRTIRNVLHRIKGKTSHPSFSSMNI
tara:strand:- start:109 stop:498 length:390 start_codon:yes stop_codon:yes gene_type:complete